MKIKAILYDIGDIFFEAHLWREWMFKEFRKKKLFRGSFADFYNLYDSFLSKETYIEGKSYDETYELFLEHMKLPKKYKDIFEKKALKKKVHIETIRKLYPHVKTTLGQIQKKGVKNIVLSDNESTEGQIREKVIGRFGINQ